MTGTKTPRRLLGYTAKDVVLSLQHMFAMLGATITVPILTGMSIPLALISAGVGTIIFYFVTKRKVPVFLGSSFAFLPALLMMLTMQVGDETVKLSDYDQAMYNSHALAVMLALVCAGLVYVILAGVIKLVGVHRIKKLFPPIVVGPVIIVIGMNLAGTAFTSNIFGSTAAPWQVWTSAIITALTIVIVNAVAKPKSFFKVIPILIGFVVGYLYSIILSVCPTPEGYAPLVNFDGFFSGDVVVFQQAKDIWGFWGAWGDLDGGLIGTAMLATVPLAIVTFMEHLGDISANSVVCNKDFMTDPGLHRTVLGDGLATMASALLGGPANTTYGENTAVLAITKNYSTRNIFLAAVFAVVLGLFIPFGEILEGMPGSVVGGASLILYGMIAANGLRALVDSKTDFSDARNMIVVSITLSVGLGLHMASFAGFTIAIGNVTISSLAIATVLAIVLNLIIPKTKIPTEEQEIAERETDISLVPHEADIEAEIKDNVGNAVEVEKAETAADEKKTDKEE